MPKVKVHNEFYIAANTFIALPNPAFGQMLYGDAHEYLMFVDTLPQATSFPKKIAEGTAEILSARLHKHYKQFGLESNILFQIIESRVTKGLWIIKGVQDVEMETE